MTGDAAALERLHEKSSTVVAVFPDHEAAERAVKSLSVAGFAMDQMSIVGKGFHSEERVVGFYNLGDRVKFWGSRGAFWGGFWGLFFGGLFLSTPVMGPVVVLGFLATVALSALENAVVVGGLSALGAALYSLGLPNDSVVQYESDIKADAFLVMAQGSAADIERAKAALAVTAPSRLDVHVKIEADTAAA